MTKRRLKLTHPGDILLEEFMRPVGLSAFGLAKSLHVALRRVNEIVRDKRAISPEIVILLSAYFGTSEGHWINLQTHYDLSVAWSKVARHAARIVPHPHDANGRLRRI
jgi:antitoxin HigA-1